jgi:hypothetical protein
MVELPHKLVSKVHTRHENPNKKGRTGEAIQGWQRQIPFGSGKEVPSDLESGRIFRFFV